MAAFAHHRAALTAFARAEFRDRKARFAELLALRRTIAFSNPLLRLLGIRSSSSAIRPGVMDALLRSVSTASSSTPEAACLCSAIPLAPPPRCRDRARTTTEPVPFGESHPCRHPPAAPSSRPPSADDGNTIAFAYVAAEGSRDTPLASGPCEQWPLGSRVLLPPLLGAERDGTRLTPAHGWDLQ